MIIFLPKLQCLLFLWNEISYITILCLGSVTFKLASGEKVKLFIAVKANILYDYFAMRRSFNEGLGGGGEGRGSMFPSILVFPVS